MNARNVVVTTTHKILAAVQHCSSCVTSGRIEEERADAAFDRRKPAVPILNHKGTRHRRAGCLLRVVLAAVTVHFVRADSESTARTSATRSDHGGDLDCRLEDAGGFAASFAVCCQTSMPGIASRSGFCDGGARGCADRFRCQQRRLREGDLGQRPVHATLTVGSRAPVSLPEMRAYFEVLVLPYLSEIDSDPVFLDVEYLLPPALLVLAAEAAAKGERPMKDFVVFDVGAFIGHFSHAALALWDAMTATSMDWPDKLEPFGAIPKPGSDGALPPALVYAVEPASAHCRELGAANGSRYLVGDKWMTSPVSSGRVVTLCAGASSSSGHSYLTCPGSSRATLGFGETSIDEVQCDPAREKVKVIALDELAADMDIASIAFLKVDVEGNDFEVLRGATNLFRQHRIRFVVFEASDVWEQHAAAAAADDESRQKLPQSFRQQIVTALEFMEKTGDYSCYLVAPEFLVPLSGHWFSYTYSNTKRPYNVLCGWRKDPALLALLRLYSVSPRSAQFSLASVPPSTARNPVCWACADVRVSDSALRREMALVESYFASVYRRALSRGWRLSYIHFAYGRYQLSIGDHAGASASFKGVTGESWVMHLEAARELDMCARGGSLFYLRCAAPLQSNVTLPRSARPLPSTQEAETECAVQLAHEHLRPGRGALFGAENACEAERWNLRAGLAGNPVAALYAGFSLQHGLCSGVLGWRGLRAARRWYREVIYAPGGSDLVGVASRVLSVAR